MRKQSNIKSKLKIESSKTTYNSIAYIHNDITTMLDNGLKTKTVYIARMFI